jgi:hypothetical protein
MSITKLAEAREYRESVQILRSRSQANEPAPTKRTYPDTLVALQ